MTISFEAIRAIGGPIFVIFWGMVVLLLDLGKTGEARRGALPTISATGLIVAAFLAMTSGTRSLSAPQDAGTSSQVPGIASRAASVAVAPSANPSGQQSIADKGISATTYFGGGITTDRLGELFSLILCIVAFFAIIMSPQYLAEKGINQGEFYALILFSTAGAMLMAMSYDLVNVFVGLEILSVSLYILAGFARRERRSEEAAVKYFLLGAFASGFLLYGIALVYGSVGFTVNNGSVYLASALGAGYTNLDVISLALQPTQTGANTLISSPIFIAGVAMVIVGLGFKAAIVPFHSYAPDVYEGSPTPVTAFMSVAAKIGAFAALIRLLLAIASSGSIGPFHSVVWGLAAATMVVGNILAIRQPNIKRMLAYSSIAHAGYILVGVLASTSQQPGAAELAQNAVRSYLFAYTFMNLGGFAVILWLGRPNGGEYLNVRDYDGLGKRQPLAAAAMTIVMLSLAGVPPTAGFIAKLFLFMSAFQAGEPVLATIGLVVSAIGVFYYLSIIVAMYFREPKQSFDVVRGGGAKHSALLCSIAIIIFGIFPGASGAFAPAQLVTSGTNSPAAATSRSDGDQRRPRRRSRRETTTDTARPAGDLIPSATTPEGQGQRLSEPSPSPETTASTATSSAQTGAAVSSPTPGDPSVPSPATARPAAPVTPQIASPASPP